MSSRAVRTCVLPLHMRGCGGNAINRRAGNRPSSIKNNARGNSRNRGVVRPSTYAYTRIWPRIVMMRCCSMTVHGLKCHLQGGIPRSQGRTRGSVTGRVGIEACYQRHTRASHRLATSTTMLTSTRTRALTTWLCPQEYCRAHGGTSGASFILRLGR